MANKQATTAGEVTTPCLALRPREAAAAIGISSRTLWAITADRDSGIPHIRLSARAIIYPMRELQDWLAARIETPGGAKR